MIALPPEGSMVDSTRKAGKIASMIRNLIKSAMRESIEAWVTPQLDELKVAQKEQSAQIAALDQRLSARIDATNNRLTESFLGLGQRTDGLGAQLSQRIDTLGERLDHRIDELSRQQGRIVEEVAALKRDKESAADLTRRVTRIEDRLFAGSS